MVSKHFGNQLQDQITAYLQHCTCLLTCSMHQLVLCRLCGLSISNTWMCVCEECSDCVLDLPTRQFHAIMYSDDKFARKFKTWRRWSRVDSRKQTSWMQSAAHFSTSSQLLTYILSMILASDENHPTTARHYLGRQELNAWFYDTRSGIAEQNLPNFQF